MKADLLCKQFYWEREIVGLVPKCKKKNFGGFMFLNCYGQSKPKLDCYESRALNKRRLK